MLSALIGLQRELRQESAGLRTLAACTSRGTATEPAAWLSDVDGVLAVTAGDVDEDADQRGPAGGHPGAGIFPAPSLLTWSCR